MSRCSVFQLVATCRTNSVVWLTVPAESKAMHLKVRRVCHLHLLMRLANYLQLNRSQLQMNYFYLSSFCHPAFAFPAEFVFVHLDLLMARDLAAIATLQCSR